MTSPIAAEIDRTKAVEGDAARRKRRAEQWLFAATEGLPDEEADALDEAH